MSYQNLKARLDRGDVIYLDGAVGTQLQAMGVPLDPYCWAAIANDTHPYTVRKMHEDYIRAGVDVITTNTYSAARHNYELVGLADRVIEMNLRAVVLAQEARERVAKKPVYIAGAISNFGGWTEEQNARLFGNNTYKQRGTNYGFRTRSVVTPAQVRRNLCDQADMLAEAGVDFIMAEATGNAEQREWVLEAAASVEIPFWAGFKCHVNEGETAVLSGYASDSLLANELDARLPLNCDVLNIFHSNIEDTTKALPIVKEKWSGAVGTYPEAGRRDYVQTSANPDVANVYSPEEYAAIAQGWVAQGVQVVGGCCGMGLPYVKALAGKLPDKIPS
ncbi:MAG: homocysteine S-methyltransferase family protein [Chloroflexota bacterium]